MSEMRGNNASLRTVAFVGSPLQYASFTASTYFNDSATIVGHRGMPGNISFCNSVLNDASMISQLDEIFGSVETEVFIPHSICLLYFACAAHPWVKKISYLDEGTLTIRYLEETNSKKHSPQTRTLIVICRILMLMPNVVRAFMLRVLSYIFRKLIVPLCTEYGEYMYQEIDRRFKTGTILSHIESGVRLPNVEFVDIRTNLKRTKNYDGAACMMIHPNNTSSQDGIQRLVEKLISLDCIGHSLLLRPHPQFEMHKTSLNNFCAELDKNNIEWEFAQISKKQEVAFELYANGVRSFILSNESTIGRTVLSHPSFFEDLTIIKL